MKKGEVLKYNSLWKVFYFSLAFLNTKDFYSPDVNKRKREEKIKERHARRDSF